MNDDFIRETLNYDPLAEAEHRTGKSYKTDESVSLLGLVLAIDHNAKKVEMLRIYDDTQLSNTLENYLRITTSEGFEIVLELPFEHDHFGRVEHEKWVCMYHRRDGILLSFDTFGGDHVNGGKFYYNWLPTCERDERWKYTESGGAFTLQDGQSMAWSGHHDCREALRFHLRMLREHGSFVVPWEDRPFLWPLDYGFVRRVHTECGEDRKKESAMYDRERERRLLLLPEFVRAGMGMKP